MSFSMNFPLFLIVLSLLSAVVSSLLGGKAARRVTLGLTVLSFLLNAAVFVTCRLGDIDLFYKMGHFSHPWGNELRINQMNALISAFFSLVLTLTVLGGGTQLKEKTAASKRPYFYVTTDLLQTAFLALAYTNDLFTGYVFVEICTLASIGVLVVRDNGQSILAAMRYIIFSLIGSGLFLLGVVFLYEITGHLLMPELKETVTALYASGEYRLPLLTAECLIFLGLSVKCGLCPFHLWMADTYGAAVPASAGILSGLVSKIYLYFSLRILFDVFSPEVFYESGLQNILFIGGIAGMVVGSIGAIREENLRRMLAYSSAAQIGYIFMGIGISAEAGVTAALFHIMAHAMTKPLLFLSAGQLGDTAHGAKKFRHLRGAGRSNPLAGVGFTIGAFSMIGLPLTAGFISKYLFGTAALSFGGTLKIVLTFTALAVSTVLNTVYFANTVLTLFTYRPLPEGIPAPLPTDLRAQPAFAVSAAVFVLMNLVFGVFAEPIVRLLQQCAGLL